MPDSERIYPRSRVARIVVWLLDRLPTAVRDEALGAYWSPAAIADAERRGAELYAAFGKPDRNPDDPQSLRTPERKR